MHPEQRTIPSNDFNSTLGGPPVLAKHSASVNSVNEID